MLNEAGGWSPTSSLAIASYGSTFAKQETASDIVDTTHTASMNIVDDATVTTTPGSNVGISNETIRGNVQAWTGSDSVNSSLSGGGLSYPTLTLPSNLQWLGLMQSYNAAPYFATNNVSSIPSLAAINRELPTGALPSDGALTGVPTSSGALGATRLAPGAFVFAYGNWIMPQNNGNPSWLMPAGLYGSMGTTLSALHGFASFIAANGPRQDVAGKLTVPLANPLILYAAWGYVYQGGGNTSPQKNATDITQSQAQSAAEAGLRFFSNDGEGIFSSFSRELVEMSGIGTLIAIDAVHLQNMYQEAGYRPISPDQAFPAFADTLGSGLLVSVQYAMVAVGVAVPALLTAGGSLAATAMTIVSATSLGAVGGGTIGFIYGGMTGSGDFD